MSIAYRYPAPFSSKAIIDACRPYDYIDEFPEVAEASRELQEKVRAKWRDLF
jgi:3-polyprenyl-4-hydroxybenzoate decarboxylase